MKTTLLSNIVVSIIALTASGCGLSGIDGQPSTLLAVHGKLEGSTVYGTNTVEIATTTTYATYNSIQFSLPVNTYSATVGKEPPSNVNVTLRASDATAVNINLASLQTRLADLGNLHDASEDAFSAGEIIPVQVTVTQNDAEDKTIVGSLVITQWKAGNLHASLNNDLWDPEMFSNRNFLDATLVFADTFQGESISMNAKFGVLLAKELDHSSSW